MKHKSVDPRARHLIRFYDSQILSAYRNDSYRYKLSSNNYDGELYGDGIYIKHFGYRLKKDGQLAIVIFRPDIDRAEPLERRKWSGFEIVDENLFVDEGNDHRFLNWYNTYIEGDWYGEADVIFELQRSVNSVNSVTKCLFDINLFYHLEFEELKFPAAQTDHAYQDAHSKVYGILIDGLSKACLLSIEKSLSLKLSNNPNNGTRKALKEILSYNSFDDCLEVISKQRKLSDHNVRSPAKFYDAFNQFNIDLKNLVKEINKAAKWFANNANVTVELCEERAMRMDMIPEWDSSRNIEPNYSINNVRIAEGKKIIRIECGFREPCEGVHNSEMIILYFDDNSKMSIDTGSNVGFGLQNMKPEEVEISFNVNFVPSLDKA